MSPYAIHGVTFTAFLCVWGAAAVQISSISRLFKTVPFRSWPASSALKPVEDSYRWDSGPCWLVGVASTVGQVREGPEWCTEWRPVLSMRSSNARIEAPEQSEAGKGELEALVERTHWVVSSNNEPQTRGCGRMGEGDWVTWKSPVPSPNMRKPYVPSLWKPCANRICVVNASFQNSGLCATETCHNEQNEGHGHLAFGLLVRATVSLLFISLLFISLLFTHAVTLTLFISMLFISQCCSSFTAAQCCSHMYSPYIPGLV
jgi:hypothetical protein